MLIAAAGDTQSYSRHYIFPPSTLANDDDCTYGQTLCLPPMMIMIPEHRKPIEFDGIKRKRV